MQLAVVHENCLIGIITDRDLCLSLHTTHASELTVQDCMTADPITVTPETPIYRTAQMLSTYKFGALPVTESNALVGMITASQLLRYFASKWDG